jgi:hypothetical protein
MIFPGHALVRVDAFITSIAERWLTMIFPRRSMGIGLLLGVAPWLSAGLAQAQTTLRYKFKEGEKILYVMEQKMLMKMDFMGNAITINMTQTVDMTWHITAVDADGKATMSQKFDRVRFMMDMPMGKVEFDSKDGKESDDPISKTVTPILKALADSEFNLAMDARGRSSDIKVPEKLLDELKNSPAAAGFGSMFSEDGFKRMIDQSGVQFPEEAIDKGKSWMQKVELKMPFGKMNVNNNCTYDGPITEADKKLHQISLRPEVSIEADPNSPATMKVKAQETKGKALVDSAAGRLVETNLIQNMEMEIGAGGQTFVQQIEQTVKFKIADSSK